MRKVFKTVSKDSVQWFPGHMSKGLRQMQQKLKMIDCIVEVHDARIPFSGRNPTFKHTVSGLKPHILVLNKKDLTDKKLLTRTADQVKAEEGINHVIFTNCKDHMDAGVRKIMPLANDLIMNSNRFHRTDEREFCIMIIGVPNVGKSSLVNIMRNKYLKKRCASPVGAVAGITRSVLTRIKVSIDPLVYLLDTPGILQPNIRDTECGMKLALCACLQDHLVGPEVIADYLLFWLNQHNRFDYVKLMGLQEPTDEIAEVLVSGAVMLDKHKKIKQYDGSIVVKPDMDAAAHHMIRAFRYGELGATNLDSNFIK